MGSPSDAAYGRPPAGASERRRQPYGRRASDAPKVPCPFCRGDESAVVRSRARRRSASIRRRRLCSRCGERFPTSERVDVDLLERELAASGNELRVEGLFDELPPATWEIAERLLHEIWGNAKEMEYIKPDFMALQHVLSELRRTRA